MSPEVPMFILILSIPVFFACLWGLKKIKVGTATNRKWIALIPTAIISPIVYVGIIFIWILSISYYPSTDFDKDLWNSNVEERYKMSEDIVESGILIGKTEKEVIELLGMGYASIHENGLSYDLGFVPGLFNIDPSFLDITFENGVVIAVEQYDG